MIEMPILLLGLLAAGVPIVIHLLHRRAGFASVHAPGFCH